MASAARVSGDGGAAGASTIVSGAGSGGGGGPAGDSAMPSRSYSFRRFSSFMDDARRLRFGGDYTGRSGGGAPSRAWSLSMSRAANRAARRQQSPAGMRENENQ